MSGDANNPHGLNEYQLAHFGEDDDPQAPTPFIDKEKMSSAQNSNASPA
jgi:hypothetical protein